MRTTVEKMALGGLAATACIAVAMVIQLSGLAQTNVAGDFRNVTIAEVRDAQGRVLLRGTFALAPGDDGEVERKAELAPAESSSRLKGNAEVEFQKDDPNTQEIEFEVSGVPPGAIVTLVLDGVNVISAAANARGDAEAEANIAIAPPR